MRPSGLAASVMADLSPDLASLARIEDEAGPDGIPPGLPAWIAGILRRLPCGETEGQLAAIRAVLERIEKHQETEMTGLTDLNANIAAMQAEWATFLADVTTALGNADSDAAVEAAAQLVAAQTAALQAADPVSGSNPA